MRYRPIPSSLFSQNRERFVRQLPPGALCVFHSNDVPQTNADGTRSFIQNSNLFWLTGIDQEDTILLLYPDCPIPERRELLFIRQTNEHTLIWEGRKLSKDAATDVSGIPSVHWTSSFESHMKKLISETDILFLQADHHAGRAYGPMNKNHRFAQWCKEEYPLHQFHNASTLLQSLRSIKSAEEIELIKYACSITHQAFLTACAMIQPGLFEYEIEAEYIREIIRRGARGFAYEPIIASGDNSCVLHYTSNDSTCKDGDVLLMDIGASYANYAADMTRTVPVNGRFSARQKQIYSAVLRLLKKSKSLMTRGTLTQDYHKMVEELVDNELVDLGLITMHDIHTQSAERPARSEYFLHRTSHSLGLDVHDPIDVYGPFQEGMVLTCEPGIYIREEGIGIRLENDILITANGPEDLMSDIPIELEEIESLMNRR